MKKIVHVMISNFYIEGAGYQENLLTRAHKRMGMEVTILTSRYCFNSQNKACSRNAETYVNSDGVKVVILDDNKRYPIVSPLQPKCKGVYDALLEEKPDIIFMHNIEYMDSFIVAKYAASKNIPLFCDNHCDFYNTPSKGLLQYFLRLFLRIPLARYISSKSITMWGTTPWRVQYLSQYYKIPKSKTDFLVMGADETLIHWENKDKIRREVREKYGIDETAFLVISGGKINKEKNIHLLAKAIQGLERNNIKLMIFGEPDSYVLKELESIHSDNIILLGWIDSNDVYDLFLASDLGCFPGTHSVLWEQAVACGLPSLFKYWEGMQHVNVNGNSILLKNISVESIRNSILSIAEDLNKYKEMENKAAVAKNEFMYSNIALKSIGL